MAVNLKTEARRWYLQACRGNIEGEFHDTACFHAQQAAEKALKSLLHYLGARKRALLTRSLVEIIRAAGKRVASIAALLEDARKLDLHYIPSRYANGLPSGCPHQFCGRQTAEEALLPAERVVEAVRGHYESSQEYAMLAEDEAT